MKRISVNEASRDQLNWLVATCEKHSWRCPWMLEKEGYAAWMSYERAWGNPTPSYTDDCGLLLPLVEAYSSYCLKKWGEKNPRYQYQCHLWDGWQDFHGFGDTLAVAMARAYVVSKLGEEVEVPEELP